MLKIRKRLAQYQELFYMIFILSMVGLVSAGFNSNDRTYIIVFAVASLFWFLKLAVTDFSRKEILIMAFVALPIGLSLLRNGEKTLVLSMMGVLGAKNISLQKVFAQAVYVKFVFTLATMALAAVGAIENEVFLIPKNQVWMELKSYGYDHPNGAYADILLLFILAILAYGEKLKWYVYAFFTAVLLYAYVVFRCRTGLVVWIILLCMVTGYRIACKIEMEKKFLALFVPIPVVMAAITFILPILTKENEDLRKTIDRYLTGRLNRINSHWDEGKRLLLGHVPKESFDNAYFHVVYNYGWIVFIILFLAYLGLMCYCVKKGKNYAVIVLAAMSIYGFMELSVLSGVWNMSLLCFAWILFKEKREINESIQ